MVAPRKMDFSAFLFRQYKHSHIQNASFIADASKISF